MWLTISIAFAVTLLIFAYFFWPKLRQNYRVSPWRYLMTTIKPTPPTATPSEESVPPSDNKDKPLDTCPVTSSEGNSEPEPGAKITLGEKEIVAEAGENVAEATKDTNLSPQNGATEKNEIEELKKDESGSDGQILNALAPMETNSQTESEMDTGEKAKTGNETETNANSELPQGNDREKSDKTETEPQNISEPSGAQANSERNERDTSEKAETEPETISEPATKPSEGQENSSETDSKLDSNPIVEPTDLDNSTEKTSEGEWQIVAAKGKKRGKVSDDESPPKGAKGPSQSPSRHGLRRTKQRQQKEWEDFVSNQSKELQKMMGGYYASEDTERYVPILTLIAVFMNTHVWYGGNS